MHTMNVSTSAGHVFEDIFSALPNVALVTGLLIGLAALIFQVGNESPMPAPSPVAPVAVAVDAADVDVPSVQELRRAAVATVFAGPRG